MRGITPHLWFDREAREAAQFYVSTFPDSEVVHVSTIHDTPSGDADLVAFTLCGQPFMAISAGPLFRFNPSVSFLVACSTVAEVDALWAMLSDGGTPLMELSAYPFSERFGWTEDRYGVSWQVMWFGDHDITQRITPTLMFVGDVCGEAEAAVGFYTSIFPGSSVGEATRYGDGDAPDRSGTIRHVSFTLAGHEFAAMDSASAHGFGFNEAISFLVTCDSQQEIDHYWDRLSAVPEAEQCGWLKDRYGLSWQVTPTLLDEVLRSGTEDERARVTEAFLAMKKFDLAELERARAGDAQPTPTDR